MTSAMHPCLRGGAYGVTASRRTTGQDQPAPSSRPYPLPGHALGHAYWHGPAGCGGALYYAILAVSNTDDGNPLPLLTSPSYAWGTRAGPRSTKRMYAARACGGMATLPYKAVTN